MDMSAGMSDSKLCIYDLPVPTPYVPYCPNMSQNSQISVYKMQSEKKTSIETDFLTPVQQEIPSSQTKRQSKHRLPTKNINGLTSKQVSLPYHTKPNQDKSGKNKKQQYEQAGFLERRSPYRRQYNMVSDLSQSVLSRSKSRSVSPIQNRQTILPSNSPKISTPKPAHQCRRSTNLSVSYSLYQPVVTSTRKSSPMSRDLAHLKLAPNRYLKYEKRPTEISSKTFDASAYQTYSTQLTRSPLGGTVKKPSVSPNNRSRVSPMTRKDNSRSPSVSLPNTNKSPLSKMSYLGRSPVRIVTN